MTCLEIDFAGMACQNGKAKIIPSTLDFGIMVGFIDLLKFFSQL